MISRATIDIAYSFLHQKRQVYVHSSMEWQRDDIEIAVADYAEQMDADLYNLLSGGNPMFLKNHATFAADLEYAVCALERLQHF